MQSELEKTAQKLIAVFIDKLAYYPNTVKGTKTKILSYLSKDYYKDLLEEDKNLLVEYVIKKLIEVDLLNDAAYLDSFVRGNNNSTKPDGSLLVYKKMMEKGIPSTLLTSKYGQISSYDLCNAKKLIEKKFGGVNKLISLNLASEDKRDITKYLINRGFKCSILEDILSKDT